MTQESAHFSSNYFQKFKNTNSFKKWLLSYVDRKGPIIPYLKQAYSSDSKLLDFGCGDGLFLSFAEKQFRCTGIDFSTEAIKRAQKRLKRSELIVGSLQELPKASFDIITCFDVLEHVQNPQEILASFKKNLTHNGCLIVSVPNTDSLMKTWRGKSWWANEDPTHISLKNRDEWIRLLNQNHFAVHKIWSSGFINHPLPPYSLPPLYRPIQFTTQFLGLSGLPLPAALSDVDFYLANPNT